ATSNRIQLPGKSVAVRRTGVGSFECRCSSFESHSVYSSSYPQQNSSYYQKAVPEKMPTLAKTVLCQQKRPALFRSLDTHRRQLTAKQFTRSQSGK
ncbi:AAEL003943-PA, partial [Aedes aegypti]